MSVVEVVAQSQLLVFVHEVGVGAVCVDGHSQQPVHYDVSVPSKTNKTTGLNDWSFICLKTFSGVLQMCNSFFRPHTAINVLMAHWVPPPKSFPFWEKLKISQALLSVAKLLICQVSSKRYRSDSSVLQEAA